MRLWLNQKAFSFVEMMAVIAIIGVGMALFSLVFFSSWTNYEINLTRIHLQQDLDSAFNVITEDVMEGASLVSSGDSLTINYFVNPRNPANFPYISVYYQITTQGVTRSMTLRLDGSVVTQNLIQGSMDTDQSFFQVNGRQVFCQLALMANVFDKLVTVVDKKTILRKN